MVVEEDLVDGSNGGGGASIDDAGLLNDLLELSLSLSLSLSSYWDADADADDTADTDEVNVASACAIRSPIINIDAAS